MLAYIVLGIIQGITEFFPVSSSGHLLLAHRLLGLSGQEIALTVVLHLGTLLAVVVFFFRDIVKAARDVKMTAYIVLVTAITGAIAFAARGFLESLFSSLEVIIAAWFATGILLFLTKRSMEHKRRALSLLDSIILGITQAIAIIPGVSRSGVTISTLLFRKLDVRTAFSFSFLVSIPAILGAAVLEARKVGFALQGNMPNLAAGFFASLVAGLASLWLLKRVLAKARFYCFGFYCFGIAAVTLALIVFKVITP
ncbi:MAG: undecaprenyl-diphosphate phosphatase [Candidatus Omnitrophica bacterium]|nr:undecaprenyl-diphosphate phosphatase [Candidatus Omnitrophota bacterium]